MKKGIKSIKLKDSFVTYDKGDDYILVDSSSSFLGLVHSNRTAAFIIECLKKDSTECEILNRMIEHYDADVEVMKEDLRRMLEILVEIGALED